MSFMNDDAEMDDADHLSFTVDEESSGARIDKYLSAVCEDLSRSRLQALIGQGLVTLNGTVLGQASRKLDAGDCIAVVVPPPVEAVPKPENILLDIVYEDDDLVVINKPAGLVVHPGAGNPTGTLVNALLYHCKESLSGIGGVMRPGIVHRLDKDTSGLMLAAKNDYAHHHLAAQLADRSLSRIYTALVMGRPVPLKGVVDRAIGRDRNHRLKMSVVGNMSREARTHYHVQQSFSEACSLVACKLETGRTHQIRVHMEAIGHPLVGDPFYGPQPTALSAALRKGGYRPDVIEAFLSFPRQALHAKEISFVHPTQDEDFHFEVGLPDDLSNLLKNI